MYEIRGTFNKRSLFGMKTVVDHVYFTSRSAASLSDAVLEAVAAGADLGLTNLEGIELPYANLRNARLRGVSLRRADLRGANLSGAALGDLRDANLSRADLSGATVGCLRGTDLSHSNLSGVPLMAEMHGANLDGANVRGVRIADWNLGRADITRCRNLADLKVVDRASTLWAQDFSWIEGLDRRNREAIRRARESRNG